MNGSEEFRALIKVPELHDWAFYCRFYLLMLPEKSKMQHYLTWHTSFETNWCLCQGRIIMNNNGISEL